MAGEPLDTLRLALMQDVLPVGLAVADRVRRGGPRELMAAFDAGDSDPLDRLRQEGEPAARQVRDNLDRLQPGLGNPVVKVSVRDVPPSETVPPQAGAADPEDPAELQQALSRISERLEMLQRRLLENDAAAESPRNDS